MINGLLELYDVNPISIIQDKEVINSKLAEFLFGYEELLCCESEKVVEILNQVPEKYQLSNIFESEKYIPIEYLVSIFVELTPNFGECVKFFRKDKNITQKQLSEKLGITQAYLSQIEKSKDISNDELKEKILNSFGITLEEWMLYCYLIIGLNYRICLSDYELEKCSNLEIYKKFYPINVKLDSVNEFLLKKEIENIENEDMLLNQYLIKKITSKTNLLNTKGKKEVLKQIELLLKISEFNV